MKNFLRRVVLVLIEIAMIYLKLDLAILAACLVLLKGAKCWLERKTGSEISICTFRHARFIVKEAINDIWEFV